jgi:DNA-directed RNA polymerase sigma subunit (sigma70/sigma32)
MRHKPNPKISEWLQAARVHLNDCGITDAEIELLKLHDGDGLTYAAIGKLQKLTDSRIRQKYAKIRRRLRHPVRVGILPSFYK